MPRPLAMPVLASARFRRGTRVPIRRLRRRHHHVAQARIAQMAHAIFHRIGFDVRRQFVHEALVRERVLQARRRAQRAGPERRDDVVHEHAFALDRSGAFARAANVARHVRRHAVAVVVERRGRGRGRAGIERLWLKAGEKSGDHVPGRAGVRVDFPARETRLRDPTR